MPLRATGRRQGYARNGGGSRLHVGSILLASDVPTPRAFRARVAMRFPTGDAHPRSRVNPARAMLLQPPKVVAAAAAAAAISVVVVLLVVALVYGANNGWFSHGTTTQVNVLSPQSQEANASRTTARVLTCSQPRAACRGSSSPIRRRLFRLPFSALLV
jgi:hypothetical protein